MSIRRRLNKTMRSESQSLDEMADRAYETIPKRMNCMHSAQHDVRVQFDLRLIALHRLNVIDPTVAVTMLIGLSKCQHM